MLALQGFPDSASRRFSFRPLLRAPAECSSVPYIRIRSTRRQLKRMEMHEDETREGLNVLTLEVPRRTSCPEQGQNAQKTNYDGPERPATSCGFHNDIGEDDETDITYSKSSGLLSRSSELLGNVRRSMKKYTKNKMTEGPTNTDPKLPQVMRTYQRGFSHAVDGAMVSESNPVELNATRRVQCHQLQITRMADLCN
ncbi:hypothetical protein B566_EDAN007870 [Ephemera danica]|nr:hypothetical protein B566_EDAN007870 [Ephemera danica]